MKKKIQFVNLYGSLWRTKLSFFLGLDGGHYHIHNGSHGNTKPKWHTTLQDAHPKGFVKKYIYRYSTEPKMGY